MAVTKVENTEQPKTKPSTLVSEDDFSIELQERVIDNPAKGNCGFYAFAIGLINIIQQEGTRETFDKWVHLDPSINSYYEAICQFDFDKPNNELLEVLQRSLRVITYNQQIEELRWACTSAQKRDEYRTLVATSTYRRFAEMYHGTNIDPHFNPFITSKAIKDALAKIDNGKVVPGHEALILAPLFISLIYGENVAPETITVLTAPKLNSPVIQALQNITQDFVWATHEELDYLANAFEVNLHTLENGVQRYPFHDLPNRNTITVNNQGNAHWTTRVTLAKKISKPLEQPPNIPQRITPLLDLSSQKITGLKTESPQPKSDVVPKELTNQDRDSYKKEKVAQTLVHAVVSPEKEHHIKIEQTSRFLRKQTQVIESDAIPLVPFDDEAHQKEFNQLIRIVNRTVLDYCNHSEGIIFSIFHHHGNAGRARARHFNVQFSSAEDLEDAKKVLIDFLEDRTNGNTHPHSFRTMLLKELLHATEPKKKSLENISKNYANLLEKFQEQSAHGLLFRI